MRDFRLLPFFLVTALLVAGCGPRPTPTTREPELDRATRLIDEGRFNEAIKIAETYRTEHRSERADIVLASAFAGLGGVRVSDFWGFVVGYKGIIEKKNDRVELKLLGASQTFADTEGLNYLIEQFTELRTRVEAIPVINQSQIPPLQSALDALATSKSGGARLYRAILGIIILRHEIERLLPSFGSLRITDGKICVLKGENVRARDILSTGAGLIEALQDLRVAFPQATLPLSNYNAELERALMEINSLSSQSQVDGLHWKACK